MTKFRKLGRHAAHRMSMLRTMVSQLVKHERIETTVAKAKEVRRLADNMVQLGKEGTLSAARQAAAFVRGDDVIHKLFTELAYRYRSVFLSILLLMFGLYFVLDFDNLYWEAFFFFNFDRDRCGGYTRVLRTRIRVGDAAPMAYIEFIDRENELRQSKPATPQIPQRPAMDPWTRARACQQWAVPKEEKSGSSD
ncbi:50S ribosomal protein L17 [Nymphaea thermarum]|nr:50S ribosomal protein L17 [Nymphaea thermarum]